MKLEWKECVGSRMVIKYGLTLTLLERVLSYKDVGVETKELLLRSEPDPIHSRYRRKWTIS